MEILFRNSLALMREQRVGIGPQNLLNFTNHDFLLPFIKETDDQCQDHIDDYQGSERKVKIEPSALPVKIKREPEQPERQLWPKSQQQPDQHDDAAYNEERPAQLLHDQV